MVKQSWPHFSKVKKTLLGRYLIDRIILNVELLECKNVNLLEVFKNSRSLTALLRKCFLSVVLFSDFYRTISREEGWSQWRESWAPWPDRCVFCCKVSVWYIINNLCKDRFSCWSKNFLGLIFFLISEMNLQWKFILLAEMYFDRGNFYDFTSLGEYSLASLSLALIRICWLGFFSFIRYLLLNIPKSPSPPSSSKTNKQDKKNIPPNNIFFFFDVILCV